MKIEMLESLGYSYLRHVKNCWVVQANWKASDNWPKQKSANDLDAIFREMRNKFDGEESEVFKGTRTVGQFLKQAEVDVIGVDVDGDIFALETAFHEGGLNYGDTRGRVLKKLLRTCLVLNAFNAFGGRNHVYFLSPKVNPRTEAILVEIFDLLFEQYPDIAWRLLVNKSFDDEILKPTLNATKSMTDTSELFIRAVRLLHAAGSARTTGPSEERVTEKFGQRSSRGVERIQPLVRQIMQTLLEQNPSFLHRSWRHNLQDGEFCANYLGLKINNLALLRPKNNGRIISGHARYWKDVYSDEFYVCSQWWQENHIHNANSLMQFLTKLEKEAKDDIGRQAVVKLKENLFSYIERNSMPTSD